MGLSSPDEVQKGIVLGLRIVVIGILLHIFLYKEAIIAGAHFHFLGISNL